MGPEIPVFLFLSVGAVSLFSFVGVAAWANARRREREAYYKSEVLKKITETQGAGTSSALELFREQEKSDDRRRRENIKLGGLIMAAAGVGVMIFLRPLDREPAYLCGLIPLFIGIALLVYAYALAPKQ